jgi:AcrR family transcriptional regulator
VPRIVDHDAQRGDLLARSFSLFADQGYGGVTMRGLGKHLGVSTGTLYHYFSGKPDIFGQMLGSLAERDIADAESLLHPDQSPAERLEALARWLTERGPYLRRLLLLALDAWRLDPSEEGRAALTTIARTYSAALTDRLQLPSEEIGRLLFTLVVGSIVHGTLDPDVDDRGLPIHFLTPLLPLLG